MVGKTEHDIAKFLKLVKTFFKQDSFFSIIYLIILGIKSAIYFCRVVSCPRVGPAWWGRSHPAIYQTPIAGGVWL